MTVDISCQATLIPWNLFTGVVMPKTPSSAVKTGKHAGGKGHSSLSSEVTDSKKHGEASITAIR